MKTPQLDCPLCGVLMVPGTVELYGSAAAYFCTECDGLFLIRQHAPGSPRENYVKARLAEKTNLLKSDETPTNLHNP